MEEVWAFRVGAGVGWWCCLRVLHRFNFTGNNDLYIGQIIPDHLLEGPLHFVRHNVVGPFGVIEFAVVPNKFYMIEHFLDGPILPALKLVLDLLQMHGILDDIGVIEYF